MFFMCLPTYHSVFMRCYLWYEDSNGGGGEIWGGGAGSHQAGVGVVFWSEELASLSDSSKDKRFISEEKDRQITQNI